MIRGQPRRQLELRIALTEVVVTGPTALVVMGVLSAAVDFSADQLYLAAWLTGGLTPVFLLVAWAFKRRRLSALFDWLDRRERDGSSPERTLLAFEQAMGFPREGAGFLAVAFCLVGVPVTLLFPLLFDDFGVRAAAMLTSGTVCVGLIAVVCDFVLVRRLLLPARQALAAEIPRPEARASVVRPISLTARLVALMAAFMLFTAYTMAVVATGRSSAEIKGLLTQRQEAVLDRMQAAGPMRDRLARLGAEERGLLEAAGIHLALVSADGEETLDGWAALEDDDRYFLRNAGPRGRVTNPAATHILSYRRLGEEGPLLVAATPLRVLRAGMTRSAWGLAFIVLVVLGGGVAIATTLARELTAGVQDLRLNLDRIAAGDLASASPYESEDEIGGLSRSADAMHRRLRQLLAEMSAASADLQETGRDLESVSHAVGAASEAQDGEGSRLRGTMQRVAAHLDRLSSLADELGQASDSSAAALEQLRYTGRALEDSGTTLHEKAAESLTSLHQISDASGQVSTSSTSLDDVVSAVADDLERFLGSIDDVRTHAKESAEFCESVIVLAREGQHNVDRTVHGMREIQNASEEVDTAFRRLGESSGAITEIADVIKRIADETNLLSLNASIVAAQSGEHGRAFAVVAGEITSLAQRVQSNTERIREQTGTFDQHAKDARSALERSADAVASGLDLARTSQQSLEQITQTAQSSAERAAAIAGTTAEQSEGTRHLKAQIARARMDVEAIREMAASHRAKCDEVTRYAMRVGEVASGLEHSAAAQAASGDGLAEGVNGLRRAADEMKLAVGDQAASCNEMSHAVETLREHAETERASFLRLCHATERLQQRAEVLRANVERFTL